MGGQGVRDAATPSTLALRLHHGHGPVAHAEEAAVQARRRRRRHARGGGGGGGGRSGSRSGGSGSAGGGSVPQMSYAAHAAAVGNDLINAVLAGNAVWAQLLIDSIANARAIVSSLVFQGRSLVVLACISQCAGAAAVVTLLLRAGASAVGPLDKDSGYAPLHFAAMGGDIEVCAALLRGGADPAVVDLAGLRPFELAAVHKRLGAHEVLRMAFGARGSGRCPCYA